MSAYKRRGNERRERSQKGTLFLREREAKTPRCGVFYSPSYIFILKMYICILLHSGVGMCLKDKIFKVSIIKDLSKIGLYNECIQIQKIVDIG